MRGADRQTATEYDDWPAKHLKGVQQQGGTANIYDALVAPTRLTRRAGNPTANSYDSVQSFGSDELHASEAMKRGTLLCHAH